MNPRRFRAGSSAVALIAYSGLLGSGGTVALGFPSADVVVDCWAAAWAFDIGPRLSDVRAAASMLDVSFGPAGEDLDGVVLEEAGFGDALVPVAFVFGAVDFSSPADFSSRAAASISATDIAPGGLDEAGF